MSVACRAVRSTEKFVQAPVRISVSIAIARSTMSVSVPANALARSFSITRSRSWGSRPGMTSMPRVPASKPSPSRRPRNMRLMLPCGRAPLPLRWWMCSTGVPPLRAAASSVLMFSTTFCLAACSGAPESFDAPSSATTSRCMSSTIKTVRAGSIASRSAISHSSGHAGRAMPGDGRSQRVHRGGGADEERLPVRAAPRLVADVLGCEDAAEQLAVARDDVQPAGAGDPQVAVLVELLAVRDTRLQAEALHLVDDVSAAQRAVRADGEAADVPAVGVVDPERLLIGREAEPVRLLEVVGEQRELAVGRDAVDAAEVQLLLALDAEAGPAAVGRIGEDDRAVGCDHDVVGAVELLALPVRGEHRPGAVGLDAHQAARRVLADQQAALEIPGQAVALVRGVRHDLDATGCGPAAARVAGHVREQ